MLLRLLFLVLSFNFKHPITSGRNPTSHSSQVDSVFLSYKDRWFTIFGPVLFQQATVGLGTPGLKADRDSVDRGKSDPWQKAVF